jgi:hypothetical protein
MPEGLRQQAGVCAGELGFGQNGVIGAVSLGDDFTQPVTIVGAGAFDRREDPICGHVRGIYRELLL